MQDQSGLRAILQSPFWRSLGIFIIALLPRIAAIGRYVTPDEPIWVFRSLQFREALLAGDWAATIQSGHPGVTLTWLGTLAVQLQLWFKPDSREHLIWLDQLYWLSPDNGPAFQHLSSFLTAARLGPIILTSLGIVAIYWLLRSSLGYSTAELGAFFLIADPFTAGLSGLFHLDALLATFMLLAVLILLPPVNQPATAPNKRRLIGSGLLTALAILTKTPGLFLLPFIFLIICWQTLFLPRHEISISRRARQLLIALFLWAGAMIAVILLLLPAVWAAPVTVFETVSGLADRLADSAVRPVFFLGEMTLNPGPAFYPLVLAFRLSPVVWIGLLLAAVFLVARFGKSHVGQFAKLSYGNLIWLLIFSLGFLFFLNLSAKRFDRYALPAILPLIILSTVGLNTAAAKVKNQKIAPYILSICVVAHTFFLITFNPLPLTAYNWLAGGPTVAKKVFPIGWGEETSAVAKDLAQTTQHFPEFEDRTLYTSNIPAAAAFYTGPLLPIETQTLTRLQREDYVHFVTQDWQIFTASTGQDHSSLNTAIQSFIQERDITDFEEAQLFTDLGPADFMLPAFESTAQDYRFEEKIAIRSAGVLPAVWPDPIQIGIEWQPLQTADTDYFYRLELVDQAGEIWLTQEDPLLNSVGHPIPYWSTGEAQMVFYSFYPPSDLVPGSYSVQVSLFDEQEARLGVFREDGRFAGVTASLDSISMTAPAVQLPADPPNPVNDESELIGYDGLPTIIETGLPLKLDIWWRQLQRTPRLVLLRLSVGDETADYPITTDGWVVGQAYHLRPNWPVPLDLDSGVYPLGLQLFDENGRALWPVPFDLGEIEVVARPRSFTLPSDIIPLRIQLGTLALLQQADVEVLDSIINLDVTWQVLEPDGVFYTTFVHLIDESGQTVTQGDRPPLEPTGGWVTGQVIQEQYQLIRPPSGRYFIAIGLYRAENGLRLPVYSAEGQLLPDEQFFIEVTVP